MKDSLIELSNSVLIQNILKKAGINPPPVLERATAPWNEKLLNGQDIILGGGSRLQTIAKGIIEAGGSLILEPDSQGSELDELNPYKLQSFDNSNVISKAKGVVYDATDIRTLRDLKKVYQFFHGVLQHLNSNTRIILISGVPESQEDTEAQTASQAICGFGKSLAKEIGPKGSTAQIIQIPETENSLLRAVPVTQFFLSDHSAFITAQVIKISSLAKDVNSYMIPGSLAGKSILVTGAVGGIGRGTAMALADEGAHVLCLDHESTEEQLNELAKKIGGTAIPMSLGDTSVPAKLEKAIRDATGHVDVLVHNAGITRDRTLKRMGEDQWDQVLSVNLEAIHDITKYLLDCGVLRDFGRVICLSSISGLAGNFGQTNYSSAKAGLIGYVNSLSKSLAEKGITANAVAPGFIETPMTAKIPFFTRQFGRRLATLSQGGLPNDIANAICFLSSESSQGINGSVLRVCGGHMMGA